MKYELKEIFILCVHFLICLRSIRSDNFDLKQLFEVVALYDFDARILKMDSFSVENFLRISRGDILDILKHDDKEIWTAKHKTNETGLIWSFMVSRIDSPNLEMKDYFSELDSADNIDIDFIAAETIDAASLHGFVSYKEGDKFNLINRVNAVFWVAKSKSSGLKGFIETLKLYRFLTVALYDFNPWIFNLNQYMEIKKGEQLYTKTNNIDVEDLWVKSKASRLEGNIPNFLVHGVDDEKKDKKLSKTYIAMEDFDAGPMEKYLSFNEGDTLMITKQLHEKFWFAKIQNTGQMGIIYRFMFAEFLAVAKYDFDPSLFSLDYYLEVKKGQDLYIVNGTDQDEDWLVRSKKNKMFGTIPKFMVRKVNSSNTIHTLTEEILIRIIAMEDFNAEEMKDFLSFREGEIFSLLKILHSKFWYVKVHDSGKNGIIHKDKVAKHVAVALFDFGNQSINALGWLSIRKGEKLYIIDDQLHYQAWRARSVDSKLEGVIPNNLPVILPLNQSNIFKRTKNSDDANEIVQALSNFDSLNVDNFISFRRGELLCIIDKATEDTWLAKILTSDTLGYIPSFMVKPFLSKDEIKERTFPALEDYGLTTESFLDYKRGDLLYIIQGVPHARVWYARSLATQEEGYITRTDVIDQCGSSKKRCGNICVPAFIDCLCGDSFSFIKNNLANIQNGEYCCIHPTESCNKLDEMTVSCPTGQILKLDTPCWGFCHNDYRTSEHYNQGSGMYKCEGVAKCTQIVRMCQGSSPWCGDKTECDQDLKCVDGISNTRLSTELISEHHYCSNPGDVGNAKYDFIDRSDETITNPFISINNNNIEYSYISRCTREGFNGVNIDGVTCHRDHDVKCQNTAGWCDEDNWVSCYVNNKTKISSADKQLCQNKNFWQDVDCDIQHENEILQYGIRCRGNMQHCYFKWYYSVEGSVNPIYRSTCRDKSDLIFFSNKPCPSRKLRLQIYVDTFCNDDSKFKFIKQCKYSVQWFKEKEEAVCQDGCFEYCWESCADPGPDCEACTNNEYFLCEHSTMCIHKDLECDGHPQCLNGEDENFYRCKDKWIKNKVFLTHATFKCRSRIYPSMDIIATPCDKIVECLDAYDEKFCFNDIISPIVGIITVLGTIFFYFFLKYHKPITGRLTCSNVKVQSDQCSQGQNSEILFEFHDFKDNPYDPKIVMKGSNYLLYIIFSQDQENMKKILIEFYDLLDTIHNHSEAKVYAYLHRYMDPVLTDAIDEAKFPGLKQKAIKKLEKIVNIKFITNFLDTLTKREDLQRTFATFITILKLANQQSDLAKDTVVTISLLIIVGGPSAIYHFPTNFSSVVVMCFAATIILPMWMSSLQLAINNPYLIFHFMGKSAKRIKKIVMIFFCIFSPINPILLIFNHQEAKENARIRAKQYSDTDNASEHFENCKMIKTDLVEFLKLDLGLEVVYQVSLQIILLLLTQTKTPTVAGLESFFAQDSYLGLPLKPETILIISVTWSLKTCIFLHLKTIRVEKGFFAFTSKAAVFTWALFSTLRKVLSIVVFFTPSMGLFSLLHHWQAEQIPFTSSFRIIEEYKKSPSQIPQFDIIDLYNMTETVHWTDLDRWSYEDPKHPTPPHYSIYTVLTLQHTFIAFWGIFLLQILILLLVKTFTSTEFAENKDYFSKFAHLIQNTNFPFPYKDWDNCKTDSIEEFRQRYRKTQREMGWTFFATSLFTLILWIPLLLTGLSFVHVLHILYVNSDD